MMFYPLRLSASVWLTAGLRMTYLQSISMKHGLLFTLLSLNVAQAQTINAHITAIAPDNRYKVYDNGTVLDVQTSLIWKQCPQGLSGHDCRTGTLEFYTWEAALVSADSATDAGYTDWRLPNIKELASLVEVDRVNPAINLTIFPNTEPSEFWSGSPSANDPVFVWSVFFASGFSFDVGRDNSYNVRLVRGGL